MLRVVLRINGGLVRVVSGGLVVAVRVLMGVGKRCSAVDVGADVLKIKRNQIVFSVCRPGTMLLVAYLGCSVRWLS